MSLGKRLYGSRDYTPKEAASRNQVVDSINTFFKNKRFEPVVLPTIEYAEAIQPILGFSLDECVACSNSSKEPLVLRPDPTASIARLIATRMPRNFPLKLTYSNSVFRKNKQAQIQEWFQSGVEYIGFPDKSCDIEVLNLCVQAFENLGLNDIIIDINHIETINALNCQQRKALLNMDYSQLEQLPKRDSLKNIDNTNLYFKSLKDNIDCPNIYVNEGLIKNLNYYTGLIFEVSHPLSGQILATGGRYDGLFPKLNIDQTAIGFAMHINPIAHILEVKS